MFTTCLFCHAPLGANEVIEPFPVGGRLAFDAEKGRLWVVCRRCERWNLSPLEERWEAIEECERRFRGTRLRASSENVGLARLREGLELVRIGRPLRPEFAAWRYGDQFGRRRMRRIAQVGAAVGGVGAAIAGGTAFGLGVAGFAGALVPSLRGIVRGNPKDIIARIALPGGRLTPVLRSHLSTLALRGGTSADDWALCLRHGSTSPAHPPIELGGESARRAAALLLPSVNQFGAARAQVSEAVRLLDAAASPLDVFLLTARHQDRAIVANLPASTRIALEMAAHEERERRAMDGELAALEREWRDAEEIAAIADDLLLPHRVGDAMDRLRGRAAASPP